ncbi:MAG: MerR family transcriptional regulator [Chloroflexi bacterium]|nr:MerR family transcriptional regulator [Chloroflexota bacterium]
MPNERSEPLYVISIAARMVGVHAQTLRYYERAGLIAPARSQGRLRLYSQWDIERLKLMKSLMEDLGVNLAGVEVIIRLTEHIARMEGRLKALEQELQRLQGGEGEI